MRTTEPCHPTSCPWSFAALTRALDIAAERAENWTVVQHEDLCHDPMGGFEKLFAQMGLPWTDTVRRAIEQKNDRGSGYVTNRVVADEPKRWRDRLDSSQVAVISKTAARLSIEC